MSTSAGANANGADTNTSPQPGNPNAFTANRDEQQMRITKLEQEIFSMAKQLQETKKQLEQALRDNALLKEQVASAETEKLERAKLFQSVEHQQSQQINSLKLRLNQVTGERNKAQLEAKSLREKLALAWPSDSPTAKRARLVAPSNLDGVSGQPPFNSLTPVVAEHERQGQVRAVQGTSTDRDIVVEENLRETASKPLVTEPPSLRIAASRLVVVVDEILGDASCFTVFNNEDIEILKSEHRTLCGRAFEPQKFHLRELPPALLLAEQVQVLVENGWARVRRVIAPSCTQLDAESSAESDYGAGGTSRKDGPPPGKRKQFMEELPPVAPLDYAWLNPAEIRYPTTATYRKRLTVYRDLWRKGFYIMPGVSFGCEYLAYERLPGERHSKYMVYCVDSSAELLRPLNIVASTRLATQVNKKILLALVTPYSLVPQYMSVGWWKGNA